MPISDPYKEFEDSLATTAPQQFEPGGDPYAGFGVAAPRILPQAIGSVGSNGQQAGEALTLSKKSGIPGPVINADLPGAQQDIQRRQASSIVSSNPTIQQYLESDPLHAKISHDDYEHLDKVTQVAKEGNNDSLISRLFQALNRGIVSGNDETQTHKELRQNYPLLYESLSKVAGNLPDVLEEAAKLPGQVIGGFVGFSGQVAREFGMSDAWANRLERDFGIVGQGVLVELGQGPKGSTRVPKVEGAKEVAKPTLRPESAEMLKRDITPPPGFDPIVDEVHTQQAKLDSINLDKLIEERDQSVTRTRSVDAFEDLATKATENKYIQIPADAIADLYASEKKVPSADDGLLGWIPDLEQKVKDAQATGGDVEVSLGGYVARIDSGVHTKLQDFLRLRRDGVSLAESKELKEAAQAQEEKGFDVYHGSPHSFDAFSLEKIGTGEGAQVYGHGLYFAENEKVADQYAKSTTKADFIRKVRELYDEYDSPDDARAFIEENKKDFTPGQLKLLTALEKDDWFGFDYPHQAVQEALGGRASSFDPSPETLEAIKNSGNMYQARILANKEDFLDWDKPLSEQKIDYEKINEKVAPNQPALRTETGEELTRTLRRMLGSDEAVSKLLKEAGIPGLKYLDQGSRGKEEGTRNYVLFDDSLVRIRAINGNPVAEAIVNVAQVQEEALHLNPVFMDAKAAGMTEPEFLRYSKKINDRQEAIDEKAIAAASREIKRRQSTEWKANEAEVKAEVQNDTKYNPTLMADEYFRTGKSPNEFVPAGFKLSEEYKRPGLAKEMFSKNGTNPDDIAPLFGFNSGEALLNRLEVLENARKGNKETAEEHLSRIVKEETARRMESKYGNLDANIRKEAEEAVMGQQQLDILADELRHIAKEAGQEFPLTKDQLSKMIKDKFDSTSVESLTDSKKLQREVMRAGQQVERAWQKGDALEALKWAQRRLLSFGLAREALRFEKEKVRVDKNIDALTNDKEVGSVEQGHVEQARSMLNGVGYTGSEAAKPGLNHAQFVADSNGQIAVTPWMVDPNLRSFKGPEDISVKDFRDLGKSLQSIMHAGREATKLENIHGKADLQNVIFDIKKQLDRFDLVSQPINPSVGQRTKGLGRWLNAWSLLVERMLDYTDKFDPNGPLTSYLDRPLRDSNTKEIKLTEETTRKLRALQKYTDNSIMDIIPNDVIPRALNKSGLADLNRRNLRQLMGHMGSESGIEKVTKGFGVSKDAVWKLIHDNATEADWKWVSGMHEIFNDLWKESAAMQERDTGVAADPIDPVKMDSKKFGEFPGGYWPVKYDKKASNIEGHIASKNPLFDEHYTQAATPQQYTLTRTQFAAPLDLTGQLLGTHIQGMVHDVAFREAVRNAGKLINNEEFKAAMTQKWSDEYAGLMHGWLKDIANSHNVDDSYAQGAAKWSAIVRQNVTSALIFLNPGTAIKHGLTAASMSAATVGPKGITKATLDLGIRGIVQSAKDIAKSPRDPRPEPAFVDALKMVTDPSPRGDQVRQFILDSSAVMRNRNRNAQDTIRASYEKSINSPTVQMFSDARQISLQIGRFPVSLSDAVSAMPTWYSAYKDAFARTGDHGDAVFEADRQVARAHGSSAIMDKSRVMRTGEAMRWVTPLYNFWNHMNANLLQLKWDIGAKMSGREEPGANAASIGGRMFAYTVIPILAEELATAPLDEDHKHGIATRMALATIRYLGGQYIGIRDITNALAYGNEPSVGLLGTVSHAIWTAGQDIARLGSGQVVSKNWMIHAGTALGMMTGMGGTQVGKTGSFAKDLLRGSEKNLSFDQIRQGLRTGHSKPRVQK